MLDRHADALLRRLTRWLDQFKDCFGHRAQHVSLRQYVDGLLGDSARKSMSAMLARVTAAVASARSELRLAQAVARFGAKEANRRARPDPYGELRVPQGLDVSLITDDVVDALAGNLYGDFPRPDLLPEYRNWPGAPLSGTDGAVERSPGSNNWAVSGSLTASGKPLMVDDPGRRSATRDQPGAWLDCHRE